MKLLITGGAGFIGSHIVDAALAKGWSVRIIDSLGSGLHPTPPVFDPHSARGRRASLPTKA